MLQQSLIACIFLLIDNAACSGFSYEDFAQQFYSANNNHPGNANNGKVFYQPNVVSSQQPGQPITIDVPPLVVPVNFNLRSKSPHQQANLLGDVIGRLKPDVYFTPDARQILDKGIESKSRQLFAFEVPTQTGANGNKQTGNKNNNNKQDSSNKAKDATSILSSPGYEALYDSSFDLKDSTKNEPGESELPREYSPSSASYSDSSAGGIKLHHFQVRPAQVEREVPMTKEREMLLNYLANYKPIQPGVHHIRASPDDSSQPISEVSPGPVPVSLTNSNPLLGNKPWFIEPSAEQTGA